MPINNPSGRIDRSRNRRETPEYDRQRDSYNAALQASIERREKRRREEEEARRKAELQAQQDAAQAERDRQQQKYDQANTAQRAYYAANESADDFSRTKILNRQQQKDVRRRDTLNNDFTLTRDREQARDQQDQDRRRFGFDTKENEQKFGYQMMENDQQFGHQMQRDRYQHGNTLERDNMQFGYDSIRAQQQHGNTMQRDSALNEFDTQRDVRQNQFQSQRDNRLNMFDVNRDARQQQYAQQNQYQRETAEVAARWQEQIQQARNAGLDFSEAQKKEMNEMESTFRKNVLANDDLDDGLRQQAMLMYQKKLSAIVPQEKVANPKEGLDSSLIFHEATKTWYMQGRDSKGFPTYEPLGSGDGGMAEQQKMIQLQQEKERQQAEKQAEALRKAKLDRLNQFKDILREKQTAETAMGEKMYADPLKAAQEEFRDHDAFYTQEYGLDPLVPPKEQPAATGNPYRQQLNQMQQPSTFQPTTGPQRPAAVSTTNIDDQVSKVEASGDSEAAAALKVFKMITQKTGGKPVQPGSQEAADLIEAMRVLRKKGIAIQGQERPRVNTTPPYGGDFFQF